MVSQPRRLQYKKLPPWTPQNGGHLVGIVRLRTKATDFDLVYEHLKTYVINNVVCWLTFFISRFCNFMSLP
jgi:hypothetical protein